MTKQTQSSELAKRNLKMVILVFLFIGVIFLTFGLISGNSSIVGGGITVLLVGFFAFGIPMLLRKK